jgi:hypothetical protein
MLYAAFKRLRGPLAGAAAAVLVVGAASALAGSGVGGVFNLGEVNTVNGQSSLTGTTDGAAQLRADNSSTNATSFGVTGAISSSSADITSAGVRGVNDGGGAGVLGESRSTTYSGWNNGVYGIGDSSIGVGVRGDGSTGVFGYSHDGDAIVAQTADGTGISTVHNGSSGTGPGLIARTYSKSAGAYAIDGIVSTTTPGADSVAVRAENKGTGQFGFGVWASHAGGGTGLYASSVSGVGVFGASSSGLAGEFTGRVKVTGYLTLKTITGAPPSADCNEATEAGRVVVRTDGTVNLYVCRGTGGWIGK